MLVVLLLIGAFAGGSALGRSESTASVQATPSPEPTINSPSPSPTPEPTKTPTPITPAPKTPTPTAHPTPTPAPAAPVTTAPTPTPAPTAAATPSPTVAPTRSPSPAPTSSPTSPPTGLKPTFGDGTWIINIDVAHGTYTAPGGKACYWKRLSGLSGQEDDIIAENESPAVRPIISIGPTDKAFKTHGCGTWKPQPTTGTQKTSFGPGTFEVRVDIEAGTYKAPGGDDCYWARLSAFGGTFDQIIADDEPEGAAMVTINPGDKGFLSRGCGRWTKA